MKRILAAGAACLAMAGAAQAQAQASAQDAPTEAPKPMDLPRDWSATLVQDATGLHDIMIDSHPGVHDPLNPAFKPRLEEGLATALARARTTTDAGGWWWALRAYVASFEDGHVGINITQPNYGFATRWPGFLTIYRGAYQVVADREEADAATPPLGSRLVDCDGVALLPGWENSRGATLERAIAAGLGLQVLLVSELVSELISELVAEASAEAAT